MARDDLAILVADRRISRAGRLIDDEHNKICVCFCKDAKIAIGFTGIATFGAFSTADWIAATLAAPENAGASISEVVEALRSQLGPKMQSLGVEDHRLTILCVGYVYWTAHPEPRIYEISNIGAGGMACAEALLRVVAPPHPSEAFVALAGATNAVPAHTLERLKEILQNEKLQPQEILRFAIRHLQNAAKSSAALNSIGEQCNSAVLRREIDTFVTSTYHSARKTNRAYAANMVVAGRSEFLGVEMGGPDTLAGPDIRPKDLCWCNSGIEFRKCHLKKFGSVYASVPLFKTPLPMCMQVTRDEAGPSGRVFCVVSSFV